MPFTEPSIRVPATRLAQPLDEDVDTLASALRRRMVSVLGCCLLGLVVGTAYLVLAPKRFVAASTLILEQAVPAGATKNDAIVDEQAALAGSTDILRLADKDGGFANLPSLATASDPVPVVKRDLRVESDARRKTVTVTYASRNREDAVKVVDLIVEAYRDYASQSTARRAAQLENVVRSEQTKGDADLRQAQDELGRFDAAHNTASATDAATQRAVSLSQALSRAELDRFAAKKRYDDAVADAGPALTGLDDRQLEEILQGAGASPTGDSGDAVGPEVTAVAKQLADLRRIYAENHPAVIRTTQRLKQMRLAQVGGARQRWQSAQSREASLREAFEKAQRDTVTRNTQASDRARLADDVVRNRSRVEAMDRQLNDLLLSAAASVINIRVDAPAQIDNADHPPLPRPAPTLATAVAIGLVLGGLFALLGEFRETGSLRHVVPLGAGRALMADAATTLKLPVLANIPAADREESDLPADLARAAQDDPFGPIANAVRSMRMAMEVGGRLPNTVLLTAAGDRQGTTTIAINLAITIARENRRVLLIDLHFTSPQVANLLKVDGSRGLTELINGGEPVDLIKPTDVARLDVLPAGAIPADALALLNSERFGALLILLSRAYDHVIFDAPPLSRADDARIVASLCDSTVLISRSTAAALRRAAGARDLLFMIGANLLGVVTSRGESKVEPLRLGGGLYGSDAVT